MNIHRDCPTLGAAPTAHHPVIAPNKKPARKPGRFKWPPPTPTAARGRLQPAGLNRPGFSAGFLLAAVTGWWTSSPALAATAAERRELTCRPYRGDPGRCPI